MEFQTFHNYNRLVRRGLVKPLTHSCGTEFVLIIRDDHSPNPNPQPALKCFACGTLTLPGTKMYSDILAVVQEHFL